MTGVFARYCHSMHRKPAQQQILRQSLADGGAGKEADSNKR